MELAHLVLEAVRYEHWLRYHFLQLSGDEADSAATGEAMLHVPEAFASAGREAEPHFAALLDALNHRPITLEGARQAVFFHVAACCGVQPNDAALGRRLMDLVQNPDFRRELDAFHTWVQEREEAEAAMSECPPEAVPPFRLWQADFCTWAAAQEKRITTIPASIPSEGGI